MAPTSGSAERHLWGRGQSKTSCGAHTLATRRAAQPWGLSKGYLMAGTMTSSGGSFQRGQSSPRDTCYPQSLWWRKVPWPSVPFLCQASVCPWATLSLKVTSQCQEITSHALTVVSVHPECHTGPDTEEASVNIFEHCTIFKTA